MKTKTQLTTLFSICLLLFTSAMAQIPSTFDGRTPVQAVQSVADRVIRKTPFKFRAILFEQDVYFRGIKVINFGRNYPSHEPGVAYAYSVVRSERNQKQLFEIAHNDGVKVWVNGQLVFEKQGDGKPVVNEEERDTFLGDRFEAQMKEGDNTVLVKSETDGKGEWKVLIRPRFPAVPEGQQEDNRWMKLSLSNIPHVTPEVAKLANWFTIGAFPNEGRRGLATEYAPEKEFRLGILYTDGGRKIAWEIPKVEILADVIDADPNWGTLYDWNYHTAGLAWAIRQLGEFSGEQRYLDYLSRYCDFMLEIKPYIYYEKYDLNRPYSRHTHLWNTPLLDFTTAPALPFIYRLMKEPNFPRRDEYAKLVAETQDYVNKEQIRLPNGIFTRETPFKFTTWVDDLFMSVPFLLHSSQYATDPAVKKQYLEDAAHQIVEYHKILFDPARKLYHHAHYSERPEAKLPYWSRANGWAIWSASEVLMALPKNHPKYKQILQIYRTHIEGLVATQNPETGFYHNVLTERESFKETSGTAIFTMAIARGIRYGWLNSKQYLPYAVKGWQALETVIAEDGEVTDICMGTMCTEDVRYYYTRPVVKDDSHGLLGLVMCGLEMQRMMDGLGKK